MGPGEIINGAASTARAILNKSLGQSFDSALVQIYLLQTLAKVKHGTFGRPRWRGQSEVCLRGPALFRKKLPRLPTEQEWNKFYVQELFSIVPQHRELHSILEVNKWKWT